MEVVVKVLSSAGLAKSDAMWALKVSQPTMKWRDIAEQLGTSTRVVGEALKNDMTDWKAARDERLKAREQEHETSSRIIELSGIMINHESIPP
jgi:predicted transcriptional regulator